MTDVDTLLVIETLEFVVSSFVDLVLVEFAAVPFYSKMQAWELAADPWISV